mgnify:CR=1 FL=1
MRQIVLDTETTGLDPATHRIIEIGCVELVNHVPTGRTFHTYLNPERASDQRAFEVHKLSDDFLKGQPLFRDKADEFLDFLAGDQLVIHNAEFDMGFVNWELKRLERGALLMSRVIDTISIARQKYPGAQASLDALCRRFEIDLSIRAERHGALIDAGLLARVYLELIGGEGSGRDPPAAPRPARRAAQRRGTRAAREVPRQDQGSDLAEVVGAGPRPYEADTPTA